MNNIIALVLSQRLKELKKRRGRYMKRKKKKQQWCDVSPSFLSTLLKLHILFLFLLRLSRGHLFL